MKTKKQPAERPGIRFAVLNFLLFRAYAPKNPEPISSPNALGFLSGHFIVFYAYFAAVCYSAIHVMDGQRRCHAGHEVGPAVLFCDQCGESVDRDPATIGR